MRKKLVAQGNGWMLYINKDFCDLMHISLKEKNVILTIQNKILYIQNARNYDNQNKLYISKKVVRRGNAFGLYISKTLLNILEINPETDNVKIDIYNSSLLVKKSN